MLFEILGGLAAFIIAKLIWSRLTFQTSDKLQKLTDKNGGLSPKPYSAIPGPRGLPFIGNLLDLVWFNPMDGKLHAWLEKRYLNYGPIVRENVFFREYLLLYDLEHINQLIQLDGKYPRLFLLEPWQKWKEDNGERNGFFTSVGEEWKKLRTAWNKVILNSSEVYSHLDELNDVQFDATALLNAQKDTDGKHPAVDKWLFTWALENIGVLLFERRIGGLAEKSSQEAQTLIQAVIDVFSSTEMLCFSPDWFNRIFLRSHHKKHDASWKLITENAREAVDSKLKSMIEGLEVGDEPAGILATIIARHELLPEEIYSCITELMVAGVDTTANTSQFALYEIARNPKVQRKLYEDIMEVTNGQPPSVANLSRLKYLKATLREVQRMYPVGMVASRILNEDAVIGGHLIPAKTNVMADTWVNGRFDKNFVNPEEFKPERWLESDSKLSVQSSASAPFGIGSRGCIGRKVAETGMLLLLIHVLQKFELRFYGKEPVSFSTRLLLFASKPIEVVFINR